MLLPLPELQDMPLLYSSHQSQVSTPETALACELHAVYTSDEKILHRQYMGTFCATAVSLSLARYKVKTLPCRVYGPKGPVVGKKKARRAASSSSVDSVLDLQCLHVLSKRAMPASGNQLISHISEHKYLPGLQLTFTMLGHLGAPLMLEPKLEYPWPQACKSFPLPMSQCIAGVVLPT